MRGNTAAACWENSSATARIIRKINYFPSLLINFTIASMFSFPALLSRPPPLGRKGEGERKRDRGKKEDGEGAGNEERRGSFERLPLSLVSAFLDLSPSLNFLFSRFSSQKERERTLAKKSPGSGFFKITNFSKYIGKNKFASQIIVLHHV